MSLLNLHTDDLLTTLKYKAFRFFIENTHLKTGLTKDRANNFEADNYSVASIASTGYSLASLPIAVNNGWISFNEAFIKANTTLTFLLEKIPSVKGWYYHFLDFNTGKRVWDCEVSSIDTGLLLMGALCCSEFFKNLQITELSNELYNRVDWNWMLSNGGEKPNKLLLSHGWTPEGGFIQYDWDTYSELMFLYILGMGANHKPLTQINWKAWSRPLIKYKQWTTLVGGPIFIHQMSHAFFDFKGYQDCMEFDYWNTSLHATHINRQFCMDQMSKRKTYSHKVWGINACDSPNGYKAFSAPGIEDGTVSPTGAISSIIFTPKLSENVAKIYYSKFSNKIWGRYGFSNSFNVDENWYDKDVIGIDLGMLLLNLENVSSGLIWRLLLSNSYLKQGWVEAGFTRKSNCI